jgi:rhodanese-related sulfurtransferase
MAIQTVSPHEVFRQRQAGKPHQIIDVRTPREYAALHAEGARPVPLDELDPATLKSANGNVFDEPIYVICHSGARAAKACERLHAAGVTNVFNVEGGTSAWEHAGLPVVRGERPTMSLERQVRIAAGALVLLGVLLGWQFHPLFHAVSALVGVGLIFAGVSGWCGMGLLLARMPWNR